VNGRAIEDFKRFEVLETGLAVPRAEPLYRPAVSNGIPVDDFVVDDYLVLYLPLYALKGSKFKSVDRYAEICTVVGALWRPHGRLFDGDDYATVNGLASVLQALSTGSMEFWVRFTSVLTSQAVFSVSDSGDAGSVAILYLHDSGPQMRNYCSEAGTVYYNSEFTPAPNISAATWYHMVWTHDGVGPDLYINATKYDGGAVANRDKWIPDVQDIDDVSLASDNTSGGRALYLDGDIGELRIYSRVLSAAEVAHNRNATIWRYQ